MPKYLFLDNWTLSDYTSAEYAQRLANFIKSNGYTIIFNGISMTELYNPGWENGGVEERGARVARFLGDQRCVIVRPEEVWKSEAAIFPRKLDSMPIRLNLDTLPTSQRAAAILHVLRRDQTLLDADIDIVQWRNQYNTLKSRWLADIQEIIEKGVRQGTIVKTPAGSYKAVDRVKREEFLLSLDWRHANAIPSRFYEASSVMHSIRCSTLCIWYHYIDPPSRTSAKKPSDIGDIAQLSLAPYCAVCTADTKMAPTIKQALQELSSSCQIVTDRELKVMLGS
jgi:hypothetical protein